MRTRGPPTPLRHKRAQPSEVGRIRFSDPDLIDSVRVKGNVLLDLRHGCKWRFIRPHRVHGTISARRNTEVGSHTLVGAEGGVLATNVTRLSIPSYREKVQNRIWVIPEGL